MTSEWLGLGLHFLLTIATATTTAAPASATAAAADEEEVETIDDVKVVDPAEGFYGDAYPQFDRVLDHYTARCVRRKHFATLIGHRNFEPVFHSPFRDFLGFDGGGLKINLGLRYGILDWLDIGILRQNGTRELYNTYEFDARFQILRQSRHFVDFALRGGISWFNEPVVNSSGFFAEILLSHVFFYRWMIDAGAIFHSNSSGPNKGGLDTSQSAALFLAQEIRLLGLLSFNIEATFNIAGYHEIYPIITFGPKFVTNRHSFSILLSDSQYISSDSIIANTSSIDPKTWIFGFYITREI